MEMETRGVVAKLILLLEDDYSRLLGIRRDVRVLRSEFRDIDAKIFRLKSLHEPDAQTKDWVNRVRELAYDGEDWVDLLVHRFHVSGGGCTALGSMILSWLRRDRRVIARELRELKRPLVGLNQERKHWSLDDPAVEPVDPRLTKRFVDVGCLVGFDGPMEEVTKMVTSAAGKGEINVVSIVEMAGSGKTTLATAVYRQLGQHNCFQFQAFVSVGEKPGAVEKALQDILSELGDGHPEGSTKDIIREKLKDKRYLVVVDDLWRFEHWENIKFCFPQNSLDSRIITTTRNNALAEAFSDGWSDCIYDIGLLNEVDSKKLILDTAFGTGHGCPKHLEEVLAQVTRRCSGLPLALVTVPSMLEDKSSKEEWDKLVGSRWLSRPDAKAMKQILNLSYTDLPQHLKPCLLDLSIFPEDFKVDVDRLMSRWIAEEYISEKRGFTVEEVAQRYTDELIRRNMVQRLPPVHGAPRYCRLHPVIHDFIVCKSMEDNFVTLVDDQSSPTSSNCNVYRRLSVQSSKHDQDLTSYDGMELSHVRSITVFGQASSAPRLTNLRVVRVLDLEGCVGPVCLDDLDKLPLLRYLSLKGTDVAELPVALWELRFLELLDVRSTKVKQLPASIMGLRNSLRTLLFGHEGMINSVETATRIAEDIHHCHRLENIATIDLGEHPASFVKVLGDLNALRVLEIIWSFHQCKEGAYCEALLSSMEKWTWLRSLTIHCGLGCSMEFLGSLSDPPDQLEKFEVIGGGFVSVPKWIQMLSNLSFLQITICKIGTDDLNLLRGLPQLQCLIMGLDFVPREPIVIESGEFRKLLWFSVDCPVPWLTFQTGAMPKLTHLQLNFCSGSTNLESVPSGVSNLRMLREVVLLYNQKWCADSSIVKMIVDAVKRQVAKHRNLIDLIINNAKVDVQKVDVEIIKITTEVQSGGIGEEVVRTTVETQGEIEIEAECDNIVSTC